MDCLSRAFVITTHSSWKNRLRRSLHSTVVREIGGSFIRCGIGLMLRGTHYIFTSRCNLSRSGRRITSFRNIAVYCAMNSRPCCNLAVLGRCDGLCPPRAASISPSFWQDEYEIPSKLTITPFVYGTSPL